LAIAILAVYPQPILGTSKGDPMNRLLFSGTVLALSLLAGAARAQSDAYCYDYAESQASRVGRGNGEIMGNAARGAVRGGLFGAMVGDAGMGAAAGAAIGVLGGGALRSSRSDVVFERAYNDCMSGRVQ
jgi:hypothetical protein